MRRAAHALLVWLALAGCALAQMSPADEQFLTKTFPALAELEWLIQQHPDRVEAIGQKAELAAAGLGKQPTDATNYRGRRLFLQKALRSPKVRNALLLEQSELQQVLAETRADPTPEAVAQIDELLDSMVLKSSQRVTGGSIRPVAPPPPRVVPRPEGAGHIAIPSTAALGGIGAALLLGVAGVMMLSKSKPAELAVEGSPGAMRDLSRGSGRIPRGRGAPSSGTALPPGARPAGAAAGANPAGGPAMPVGRFRAVIETSGDANPMGRTQSLVFEPTAVFAPGQAPVGAGLGLPPGQVPTAVPGVPQPIVESPPPKPKQSGIARHPAPAAGTRQPAIDDSMESSKMNRTLPPYQPRGVPIRRAKKPPPANPTVPNVPPDTVPDRYRVISVLGKGGMGVVYKAFDCTGKREVAVKTLSSDVMSTDTARERFVREYETLNALDHPNIIRVYDMGCITTPYFAMEFADGEDLGTIMLDDNVAPEAVLEIGIQLANALEYAHSEGVYHRDIKPSNLMITNEGLLKIVDFGLVKDTHASSLTMDGTVLGSLRFMAPEQLAAAPVDARSDVYAMGMTLYYLLSGATPFDGHNPVVKLGQEPSSVLLHAPEADKRLAFAIDRCIRKDAKNRWQTARELEDALRAISL